MEFGNYLRNCREQQKWTQPEAAQKINIEQSYLSKLETGKSYPSEEVFNKLVTAYKIDINELYRQISLEELGKLKEIKQVRDVVLECSKAKVTTTRAWLIGGLIMISLGAAFLGRVIIPEPHNQSSYLYRSDGLLHLDEELDTFSLLQEKIPQSDKSRLEKRKQLLSRIDQVDLQTTHYKGEGFVKNIEDKRRFFVLMGTSVIKREHSNRWFIIPAMMFLFGSGACFYISRRWN